MREQVIVVTVLMMVVVSTMTICMVRSSIMCVTMMVLTCYRTVNSVNSLLRMTMCIGVEVHLPMLLMTVMCVREFMMRMITM